MADEPRIDPQQTERLAAVHARDTRAHRWFTAIAALLVLGLVAAGVGIWSLAGQQREAATAAQLLSGQVHALGATPVVSAPAPIAGPTGPTGPAGPTGRPGAAGRGITGTQITAGHLIVAYTDGRTQDVGQVVGPAGPAGKNGRDGRGITGTTVTGGHLMVSYSDHTTVDLGSIVGPKGDAGRGVVSTSVSSDFHLMVTYSDGTISDAGLLPSGPAGPQGEKGGPGADGAPGAQGAQGVSVSDLQFERDNSGQCQAVITLHDPATGQDTTVTHPAGQAACPAPPLLGGN